MRYGRRELVTVWQQQPAAAAEDWAQVLGEILPPAIGGPLVPAEQPCVTLVLTEGSARVGRPEVVRLVDALQAWLDRTRWTAELPIPPELRAPQELPVLSWQSDDGRRTDDERDGDGVMLPCGAPHPTEPGWVCDLVPGHEGHHWSSGSGR